MKKLALTSILSLTIVTPALASTADIRQEDNAISFQAGGTYFDYAETDSGVLADTETGWLANLRGGVSFLTPDNDKDLPSNLYLSLKGGASFGNTNYKGHLQNGAPATGTTTDRIYDVGGRVGRAFTLGSKFMLTPFGELGYRHWERDGSGLGGYAETYENWNALAGVMAQYSPIPLWVFSLTGSAGTNFANSLSVGAPFNSDFRLGTRPIYRLEGQVGYRIGSQIELTAGANFSNFRFGRSPLASSGLGPAFEPDSHTQETMLLLGVNYQFGPGRVDK